MPVASLVRHRQWVVAAWLLLAALLLPLAARVERALDVSARVEGSESAAVEAMLATRFRSDFARHALLVITGLPSPATPDGREALRRVRDAVQGVDGVTRTFSYLDLADTMFLGRGGEGTLLIAGLTAHEAEADALVAPLRAATSAMQHELRARHPGATLLWTGEVPLNFDLRRTSADEARAAERRVLPITLILLFIAFASVVASVLPVIAGVLAISLALGATVLVATLWPLSILLENIVSMQGLGLGIDYALLVVGRYREAIASGLDPLEAAARAGREAGRTILISGAAVGIGFAALLLVPLNELRSVAVGGLLVVSFSVLLATTLLPALLGLLGPRVEWGTMGSGRYRSGESAWTRWGRFVVAHPLRILLVGAAPLVLLALQVPRLTTSLPRGEWLPARMESAEGLARLEDMGRDGVASVVRVVLELPPGALIDERTGWSAARALSDTLAADPRVARVRSLPTLLGGTSPNAMLLASTPAFVRASLSAPDGRAVLIELMPMPGVDFAELTRFVGELRAMDVRRITGLRGTRILVGGMAAFNADYAAAIDEALPAVMALVIGGTLLALAIAFRSLVVPLKAVVLNLLSVAAAFGAVVLVFQDGIGLRLLGLGSPLDGLFPALPVLVFCIVFGLSMDYEVFLVARIADARRAGMSDDVAIAHGLARTGGLITSAAAIMVVVFAAFMLGDFVMMKVLGFALAVAVLIDATVVRVALGPALLRLAGRWNWWPGSNDGREPRQPATPPMPDPTPIPDSRIPIS